MNLILKSYFCRIRSSNTFKLIYVTIFYIMKQGFIKFNSGINLNKRNRLKNISLTDRLLSSKLAFTSLLLCASTISGGLGFYVGKYLDSYEKSLISQNFSSENQSELPLEVIIQDDVKIRDNSLIEDNPLIEDFSIKSSYEKYLGDRGLDSGHIKHALSVYENYKSVIDKTANRRGVPIPIILGVLAEEYGICKSPTNRRGYMQLYSESGIDAIKFAKDDLEGTLWKDYLGFEELAKKENLKLRKSGAFLKKKGKKYIKGELVQEWDEKFPVEFGYRVSKNWSPGKSLIFSVLDKPEKNLEAGIVYLSSLNVFFQDWSLSVVAYHMGKGKFKNLVKTYVEEVSENYSSSSKMTLGDEVVKLEVDLSKLLDNRVVQKVYNDNKNKWDRLGFYGPRVMTMADLFYNNSNINGDYSDDSRDITQN